MHRNGDCGGVFHSEVQNAMVIPKAFCMDQNGVDGGNLNGEVQCDCIGVLHAQERLLRRRFPWRNAMAIPEVFCIAKSDDDSEAFCMLQRWFVW